MDQSVRCSSAFGRVGSSSKALTLRRHVSSYQTFILTGYDVQTESLTNVFVEINGTLTTGSVNFVAQLPPRVTFNRHTVYLA
jgi:hypothetical protein